jgi:flagellar basal-body rod modification protein FlgD
MEVSTIGDISGTLTGGITKNSMGKEDFLKLLLNQLSHQDPLNPMDSTEFTSQLTQFSSLEQLSNIGSTLEDVLSLQQSMNNAQVTSMIGKTVKVEGDSIDLRGLADVNYSLSGDASQVKLSIHDSTGKTVWSKDLGAQISGRQSFIWDGKDLSGNQLPDGTYSFGIEATDINGNPVGAATSSSGVVTGIYFENGLTYLVMNAGSMVNLNQVQLIEE